MIIHGAGEIMKMICEMHKDCLVCEGCLHSKPHDERGGCRDPPVLCIGCVEVKNVSVKTE